MPHAHLPCGPRHRPLTLPLDSSQAAALVSALGSALASVLVSAPGFAHLGLDLVADVVLTDAGPQTQAGIPLHLALHRQCQMVAAAAAHCSSQFVHSVHHMGWRLAADAAHC